MNRRKLTCALLILLCSLVWAGKGGKGKPPKDPPPPADAAIAMVDGGLHVMDADGSNRTVILDDARVRHPDWSPDNSKIVFESDVDGLGIYTIDADGQNLTKLRSITLRGNESAQNPVAIRPVWSPAPTADGTHKIAYTRGPLKEDGTYRARHDIYVMNTNGTGEIHLIDTPTISEYHVSWSPDADRIVVQREQELLVFRVELDGGSLTATFDQDLTASGPIAAADVEQFRYPEWAKTQDQVAVSVWLVGESYFDIWTIDLSDPSNPVRVTNTSGDTSAHASWSSDDSRFAFARGFVLSGGSIRSVAVDGSDEQALTPTKGKPTHYKDPAWRR